MVCASALVQSAEPTIAAASMDGRDELLPVSEEQPARTAAMKPKYENFQAMLPSQLSLMRPSPNLTQGGSRSNPQLAWGNLSSGGRRCERKTVIFGDDHSRVPDDVVPASGLSLEARASMGSMAALHPRHTGVSERLRQRRFQLDCFPAA